MTPGIDRINIVLDASAAVNLLIGEDALASKIAALIGDACVMAPVIFPFEVTNIIRGKLSGRLIDDDTAQDAWIGMTELNAELWQWATLADRVWQLRGSITSYDASYIALAELMGCPLLTTDARLAAMAPASCRVELV